jgi:hypothetical protein
VADDDATDLFADGGKAPEEFLGPLLHGFANAHVRSVLEV